MSIRLGQRWSPYTNKMWLIWLLWLFSVFEIKLLQVTWQEEMQKSEAHNLRIFLELKFHSIFCTLIKSLYAAVSLMAIFPFLRFNSAIAAFLSRNISRKRANQWNLAKRNLVESTTSHTARFCSATFRERTKKVRLRTVLQSSDICSTSSVSSFVFTRRCRIGQTKKY